MVLIFRPLSRQSLTSPLALWNARSTQKLRTHSIANMATGARKQPPWKEPQSLHPAKLRILNSLTKSKNDFLPIDPEGKVVKWCV
jgi:cysteinyl-tRNA synthetase